MPTVSTMRYRRDRWEKELQETLSGQNILYGLELHFSSNPQPLVPVPELYCSSIPTCPSLLPIFDTQVMLRAASVLQPSLAVTRLGLILVTIISSPSPRAVGCGPWEQFMPWSIPLSPLAAQPFQSSLLLLPWCIFSQYFMQSLQETKKKKIPTIPSYSKLFTALQQSIPCLSSLVAMQTSHIQK